MILPTGRIDEGEMSFKTGQAKKIKTNNFAGRFLLTKQRWNYQTNGEKSNNDLDLGDSKRKCTNEIRLSVFITGI